MGVFPVFDTLLVRKINEIDVKRNLGGGSFPDNPEVGEDTRRRSWMRWLISRNGSCAFKRRLKKTKYSEWPCATTTTVTGNMLGRHCYGLLLPLWRRNAPPTNEQMSNENEKRHWAKLLAALRRVETDGYGAP